MTSMNKREAYWSVQAASYDGTCLDGLLPPNAAGPEGRQNINIISNTPPVYPDPSLRYILTDLLLRRKQTRIQPIPRLHKFERRNDQRRPLPLQQLPNFLTLPNPSSEIRTRHKVHIEHHHILCASEEASDVSLKVELTRVGGEDEMNVDVEGEERVGRVESVEGCEDLGGCFVCSC